VSAVSLTGVSLGFGVIVYALLWPGFEIELRLVIALFGAVISGWQGWAAWRTALSFRLEGDRIELHYGGKSAVVPTSAVRAIHVHRSARPLATETTYLLVAEQGGERVGAPFFRHWLSESRARSTARAVADRLGVPVEDPLGERWGGASLPALRWVGVGQEWRLMIVGLLAGAGALGAYGLVAGELRGAGGVGAAVGAIVAALVALALPLLPRAPRR
jgi:hypothetical protein